MLAVHARPPLLHGAVTATTEFVPRPAAYCILRCTYALTRVAHALVPLARRFVRTPQKVQRHNFLHRHRLRPLTRACARHSLLYNTIFHYQSRHCTNNPLSLREMLVSVALILHAVLSVPYRYNVYNATCRCCSSPRTPQ